MKKILVLLFLPISFKAQTNYSARLDSFMQAQVSTNHFNGNVLIAKAGSILYQKSFGYSIYSTKELLNNNSVFELASISKQFTAMGILLLQEKNKLKLTDSLRYYFPELPYNNITIQNLLTHTSGLPDYESAMVGKWNHKKIAFNDDVIKFLDNENIPIDFKPNAKCEYSNTAYILLASIIEKVSGQKFNFFMQENIFKPLGMQHSRIYNTRRSTEVIIPNYAYGFVYSDSLKRYVLPDSLPDYEYVIYLDGIVGDGVVNSTTGDLLIWDRALKNHSLISEKMQAEMFSPRFLIDTVHKVYYGYGEFIGENELGKYIKHSGEWPGYRTNLIRYIEQDLTIIVLSNNESDARKISNAIAQFNINNKQKK
jgi:CubicO group peptidase (beta-lactamase class C family)